MDETIPQEAICPWCKQFIGANWGIVNSSFHPDNLYFTIKHYECGKTFNKVFKTTWAENVPIEDSDGHDYSQI